ncbi:hypothetical protein XENOCAPTIV_010794 [Xenoophorus captivus]|uniref:Integrase SAM-like N-terminal domain-containing protein n=1 Tax=Xenoophorus captivus TaxID=1517983 RepID=A0ABV0QBY3_9TELE
MSQVRRLNENSNRRYQFYDRRIKNLLRKIQPDTREKPEKNSELNINSRTSDLLTQFYRQFLRSPENGNGKMRRYETRAVLNNTLK